MNRLKQFFAIVLAQCIVLAMVPDVLARQVGEPTVQPEEQTPEQPAQQTPDQEVSRALIGAGTAQASDAGSDDPIRQFAERVALRASAGHSNDTADAAGENEPFYGYYFRILSGLPARTTAGTDGNAKRADRLAVVAYPAEYRSSGVMTFIATKDGVVYQKDLGPETPRLATNIHADKPTRGWRAVK